MNKAGYILYFCNCQQIPVKFISNLKPEAQFLSKGSLSESLESICGSRVMCVFMVMKEHVT